MILGALTPEGRSTGIIPLNAPLALRLERIMALHDYDPDWRRQAYGFRYRCKACADPWPCATYRYADGNPW
jgi:hypothetical protein